MEIVKLLQDYAKTPLEKELGNFLNQKLDSNICVEKIKNKKFLIQYVKPINGFIIHTTALPCTNTRRVLY